MQEKIRSALNTLENDPFQPRSGTDTKKLSHTHPTKHSIQKREELKRFMIIEIYQLISLKFLWKNLPLFVPYSESLCDFFLKSTISS